MRKVAACIPTVIGMLIAFVLFAIVSSHTEAVEIYNNDFETGSVWPEWSFNNRGISPGDGMLLWIIGPSTDVTLTISALPDHNEAQVSFSLIVVNTGDGNGEYCCGPDIFDFSVEGDPTLLHTTFSLGSYPDSNNPEGTAATAIGWFSEGYKALYSVINFPSWTRYDFSFTFPHTDETMILHFLTYGAAVQPYPDEGYGLDDVKVSVSQVPEPSTIILLGAGVMGLLGLRRRLN